LGDGKATVALQVGEGYDTINNFELGSGTFIVSNLLNNLSFADSVNGVGIFAGNDLLAVVSSQILQARILSILPIYTANIVVPHLLAICCKTIIGAKFCVNT
jgi:hypothetical protein